MLPAGPRPTALIDFRSPDEGVAPLHLAFGAPRERLSAQALHEVAPLLARVDALARAGAWCVGVVHYEAAAAFDAALRTHDDGETRASAGEPDAPGETPRAGAARAQRPALASFAVHDAPLEGDAARAAWEVAAAGAAHVTWTDGPARDAFDAAIDRIQRAIADGELYQLNLTAPLAGRASGDPRALFAALRQAQPDAYAAYLDLDDAADVVLSVSPELFFDWRDGRLLARPMKGTAARGATPAEDAAQAEFLRSSAKERAENLMIVDLLRNDLSRIAEPFSVRVPRLFHTQAWPTVWQMSSDVTARTRPAATLADVFGALFPCGSVTGAPKVQAMRLIRALEPQSRGVYCGAIGVVQPGGAATFNVPIRTLVLRRDEAVQDTASPTWAVRCGIGSAITADASAAGEWAEWRHKRAFLDRASQPFELLETLRLESGAFVDGPAHLERLVDAARHFGFASPATAARDALSRLGVQHAEGRWRVRLLADRQGAACAEAFALAPTPQPVRFQLASTPLVGSDSEFVRFKTTRRAHYDAFAPPGEAVFDILLWNERGELTEFTRGNVALCIAGQWWTPALRCGLLPGIGRARALREGRIQEAVLTRADLERADAIAFINSLRGWLAAERVV